MLGGMHWKPGWNAGWNALITVKPRRFLNRGMHYFHIINHIRFCSAKPYMGFLPGNERILAQKRVKNQVVFVQETHRWVFPGNPLRFP